MKRYVVFFYNVIGEEVQRRTFRTRKEAEHFAHFQAPFEFKFNNYKIKRKP